MNLIIDVPNGDLLEIFIPKYVYPMLQLNIMKRIDIQQCKKWTKYINSTNMLKNEFPGAKKAPIIGARDIILASLRNFKYLKHTNQYEIVLNGDVKVPRTQAKLIDICSLMNYGNIEMSPYPIFEDAFKETAIMLPILFRNYIDDIKYGGGGKLK